MKGLVVYAEDYDKASEIKDHLEKQKGYGFDLISIETLIGIPENISFIASDWNVSTELYKLICNQNGEYGIAFYNRDFFSDIDDTAEINDALNKALSNKNWDICKGINRFYLMGDIIRKRDVLKSRPTRLQIEATDLCNAKCIMCSHAYRNGTGIDIMQSGILDRVKDLLPYLGVIVLHGNGEPFLKDNITDYFDILSGYGIKFIANTNLSVVTDDLLSYFASDFVELNISCDGHVPELYESIRKGLSFDIFSRNVKLVREKCPDLLMKMHVVLMRQNLAYMSEIVSFAGECGFNEVVFNQLCPDEKNNNLGDSPRLYMDEFRKNAVQALEKGLSIGIKVIFPDVFNLTDDNDPESESQEKTDVYCDGICDWTVEGPYIDLRGNVAVCCMNQKVILGNLFRDDFDLIWNGEGYRNLRNMFRSGLLPSFCNGCDFVTQNRLQYFSTRKAGYSVLEKKPRD